MACSELPENLPFNHERMWIRHIDEERCQAFSQSCVRGTVNRHRYRASICLPPVQRIQTGERQQCMAAIRRLQCHHRHLRLFIRSETGDGLPQTSCCCHNWNQESLATKCGNSTQVSHRSGLRGSCRHSAAGFGVSNTCVTGEG
jgi:hypothetical protein